MNSEKVSLNNNLLNLLGFFSTITFCADIYNSRIIYFKVINFLLLIVLSVKVIDLKKINLAGIFLSLLSLTFMIISCLTKTFDVEIFLKYALILMSFLFCVSKKKELDYTFFRYLIYYPFLLSLSIGFIQIIIISFFPQFTSTDLGYHTRPIGLSVEPTFYSQQILILYAFCEKFKLRKEEPKKFGSIINFLVIVLILFCRTRTTLIAGMIYLFLNQKKLSKNFLLLLSSTIILSTNFITTIRNASTMLFKRVFNNFLSIQGEPREVVFREMLLKINNLPVFGYGFDASPHDVGLMFGSLYANLPISVIYTLGLGSIPFLSFLLFIFVEGFKKYDPKLLIIICIFLIPMPFLYTSFGLFSLSMSTYDVKDIKLKVLS